MSIEKNLPTSSYLDGKLMGVGEVVLGMGYGIVNGRMSRSKEHIVPRGLIEERLKAKTLEEYPLEHTNPTDGITYEFSSNFKEEIAAKFGMAGEAPIGPIVIASCSFFSCLKFG